MIQGTYRFYQHGKLIAAKKNLITTEGRRVILRYLAGSASGIGGAIALGTLEAAPTVDDTRLGFEIHRATVTIRNVDYTANTVLFKGSVEQEAEFKIYEAGLWSSATNSLGAMDSQTLSTFDTETEEWTNVTVDATQSRSSADSVRVDATASATTSARTEVEMDLTGYSPEDVFALAFYKADNNIASLTLAFENTITGGSLKLTKTISALPAGYNVVTFRKGDFVAAGSIAWDSIDTFGVDVTAGGTAGYVILDGIRIEDTDTPDQEHILISRTILDTPLVKTSVAPMDVEYSLEFSVS
jgi:hypothetical protein